MSRFIFGGLGATLASTFFDLGIVHNGETSVISVISFRMGLLVPIVASVGILILSLRHMSTWPSAAVDQDKFAVRPSTI